MQSQNRDKSVIQGNGLWRDIQLRRIFTGMVEQLSHLKVGKGTTRMNGKREERKFRVDDTEEE